MKQKVSMSRTVWCSARCRGLGLTTECVRNSVISCDDGDVIIARSEELLSTSQFLVDGCADFVMPEIPEDPGNAGGT